MKRVLSGAFLAVTLLSISSLSTQAAPDLEAGKKIFSANCAACHRNGGNTVNPKKTLSLADLKANQKDTLAAVSAQVTNGKSPMPAFGKTGKLKPPEIESVAAYVLDQANKGWKK
jgi:cytochrome c6